MRLGPLPVGRARGMYAGGKGRMLVKVASLWPVVDASGEQMDRAAMMRYLSEMPWFPAAFLAGNISFEAVDDSSARVTLTDHGRTATGTLVFDQDGRLTDFVAKRYRTPTPAARKRGRPRSPATASSKGSGCPHAARRSISSPAGTLSTST